MTNRSTVVICEGRSAESTRRSLERDLAASLVNWPNVETAIVPHLYDLEPDGPVLRYLQSIPGDMIVLAWLYPRAAYWVLDANHVKGRMGRSSLLPDEEVDAVSANRPEDSGDLPDRTIWCLDLHAHNGPTPLLEEVRRIVVESTGEPVAAAGRAEGTVANGITRIDEVTRFRWYPVVDYSRCANCLECLNFCLFGVFGLDDSERLFVEQPDACRDGCPACARVCPSQAIMFPHHGSPAIAGDPAVSARQNDPNLVQLFGGTSPGELAATERDRALAEKAETEKDDLDRLVDDLDEMEL